MASASTLHLSQPPQKKIIVYEYHYQRLRPLIQQKLDSCKQLLSLKNVAHDF